MSGSMNTNTNNKRHTSRGNNSDSSDYEQEKRRMGSLDGANDGQFTLTGDDVEDLIQPINSLDMIKFDNFKNELG